MCDRKENQKRYEIILERGVFLDEFPLGAHPAPENVSARNRIGARLPLGGIVVERAQFGGPLITVPLAIEFSPEVFGVPGNATRPGSIAPNQFIKQGAKFVTRAEAVIEKLPKRVRTALGPAEMPEAAKRDSMVRASPNPVEKRIYDLWSADESRQIDDIVQRSGLNSSEVLATLFDLEMKGVGL